MPNKYRFWLILTLLVAFAAGIVGGLFSERYYFHRKRHVRPADTQRSSPHFPSLEQMAQELKLSTEQQEKIKQAFMRTEAKFKELRADMHARLRAIRADLKAEIEAVLTEEQRQKFEAMIENYLRQRKQASERREGSSRERSPETPKGEMK